MKYIFVRPQKLISMMTELGYNSSLELLVRSLVITLGIFSGFTIPASAQITHEGDKAAIVPVNGTVDILVNKGQRGGGNLFHSFDKFNVSAGQTANFISTPDIQNILGRVNGSNGGSLIDGKLQVTGAANLFLMNPAGIVFGKGASLDINGAFTATTAKAIDFNGKWFNAIGDNKYTELTGNPIGLAFTGGTPGSIFSAATLSNAQSGKSITLVGGTVISTGDIKTAGGNISIATVDGGKYVKIKVDGSILSLELPTALPTSANSINSGATSFTPLNLAKLLTDTKIDLAATGVKTEKGVVTLVGDAVKINADIAAGDTISKPNRAIFNGDVITSNLDASNISKNSGNIYIDSSRAILTKEINTSIDNAFDPNPIAITRSAGSISLNAQNAIKTDGIDSTSNTVNKSPESPLIRARGGNVKLVNKEGDIIIDWIQAQVKGSQITDFQSFAGGDLFVRSAGALRAIKPYRLGGDSDANISINTAPLGAIDMKYRGNIFVTGVTFTQNAAGENPFVTVIPTPGFNFPNGISGSRGAVSSSVQINGSVGIIYTNEGFVSSDRVNRPLDKFKIEGTANNSQPDPKTDPKNPDQQASRPKSKENCTPSSTSVASNPTAAPTRSAGNPNTVSADPCQPNTSSNEILQILRDRE